jgi:uncharacterized protein (DUF169 family)
MSDGTTMLTPAEIADTFATALLLSLEPVGVTVFDDADRFEAWPAPRPEAPVSYCAAVRRAAGGSSIKLARQDISCDTAPRTLGLEPGFLEDAFVESYVTGGLYADRTVADAVLTGVATLEHSVGVGLAPLAAFAPSQPPDVAIVAVRPYAAMRIAQAAAFTGRIVRSAAIGMHGLCSECTAAPLRTNAITTSLLCSAARHAAGWDDHLMALGMPMRLAGDVAEGLIATAERYESDERKPLVRAACRSRLGADDSLAGALTSLTEGAAYFITE